MLFQFIIAFAFLLLCCSQLFAPLSTISNVSGINNSTITGLITNEQVHKEEFFNSKGVSSIDTIMLPIGSIIQFNCTVLSKSNSSVFFVPFYWEEVDSLWDPVPINLTLAPGDSFEETHTVLVGTSSDHTELGYYIELLTENSNATIHWWYEVHKTGKISTAGFLALSGALILLSLGAIVHNKRKVTKINR